MDSLSRSQRGLQHLPSRLSITPKKRCSHAYIAPLLESEEVSGLAAFKALFPEHLYLVSELEKNRSTA
jgi:hypothetical protein